jgi:hypothetical protein
VSAPIGSESECPLGALLGDIDPAIADGAGEYLALVKDEVNYLASGHGIALWLVGAESKRDENKNLREEADTEPGTKHEEPRQVGIMGEYAGYDRYQGNFVQP